MSPGPEFENADLAVAMQVAVSGFVRSFGLLQPGRTPCGLDLHISEAHSLLDLAEFGPITQHELGQRLELRKSTVSRLVQQLVERGWVRRGAHPSDLRSVLLSLTDAGIEVAERVDRARVQRFRLLLDAIPEASRPQVVDAVHLLAAAARTAIGAGATS
jgi:DNA-binding MarR family transcriptional regulator